MNTSLLLPDPLIEPGVASLEALIFLQSLARTLGGYRFRFVSETELQDGIAKALARESIAFDKEMTLPRVEGVRTMAGMKDRPDFMINGIAVEVKIKGGLSAMLRQMARYAEHPQVHGVLAIGTPRWLSELPASLSSKPVLGCRLLTSLF